MDACSGTYQTVFSIVRTERYRVQHNFQCVQKKGLKLGKGVGEGKRTELGNVRYLVPPPGMLFA